MPRMKNGCSVFDVRQSREPTTEFPAPAPGPRTLNPEHPIPNAEPRTLNRSPITDHRSPITGHSPLAALLREDLYYAMDYELWLRFAECAEPHTVPEVLAHFRAQAQSKTAVGADGVLLETVAVARPCWRRRGLRRWLQAERGWRRNWTDKLFRRAFDMKQSGERSSARRMLMRAVAAYPPCLLRYRTLNLAARLLIPGG